MKKSKFLYLALIVLFITCQSQKSNKINIIKPHNSSNDNNLEINTMISFNDTKDTVIIFYSGQCAYEYPIYYQNDSIFVLFDTIEDCVHRSGVKEFYNLPKKDYPSIGSVFIIMKIDSIRSYNRFLYPKWVDSVNNSFKSYKILSKEFIVPIY